MFWIYIIAGLILLFGILKRIKVFDAISAKKTPTKFPYQKRDYLLTIAERKFYDVLSKIAEEQNYLVFAKVRLEDLLWLPKNTENRLKWRGYVRSRHIDFVLCNKENIRPLLAIELDDSSHQREDRIERDERVDRILRDSGLPILHVRTQNFYNLNLLAKEIQKTHL